MRYARSKNLTTYDVLIIGSMIEREVQVPKERKLVAAVIYNRLHDGMPLQIDATIRYASGNFTKPISPSELQIDSPYNTYTNSGLPPGPIGNPGLASIEAAAHPAQVPYLYYVVKPNTCGEHTFATTEAEFNRAKAAYDQARAANGGNAPTPAQLPGLTRKRLAVLGQPISHSRSPAMHNAALAELGLAGEWSYEAIEVAPADFEARVRAMAAEGFVGANVTVPHKVAALELADEASEAARAIGAANTLSFADGRIAAENTDATGLPGLAPGAAGGQARPGARRRRLGARGGLGAGHGRAPRCRSGTAPPRGPSAWRTSWARSALRRRATSDWQPADFDLIVNATTVGMGAPGEGRCRPQEPAHPCRFVGRDTPIGGPRLRAGRDGARQGGESARRHGRRRARGAGSPGGRVASDLDGTGPPDRDDAPGRQSQMSNLEAPRTPETSARHRARRPPASSTMAAPRPPATGSPRRCTAATRGCSSPT